MQAFYGPNYLTMVNISYEHKRKLKQGTLHQNFVECLVSFYPYSLTSTVTPDLNSAVNLSSKIVTFSISCRMSCSSYSLMAVGCSLRNVLRSAIRFLSPSRFAFSTCSFCFCSRSMLRPEHGVQRPTNTVDTD